MNQKLRMNQNLRESLVETARQMNRQGINTGRSGNLSTRIEGGMLVTPSGVAYETMSPEDIVPVEGDGEGQVFTGTNLRPSSEWRFHRDIYAHRPDLQAIVHAHPVYCTTLSCLRREIPAFHYEVALAGGNNIRCAPYATFGTQDLSDSVVDAMQDRSACLIENHGVVCAAGTIEDALALAVDMEFLARTYYQCLTVGKPHILSDEEMNRVAELFAARNPATTGGDSGTG
jgi:L-fuculose-phosphate aldolase